MTTTSIGCREESVQELQERGGKFRLFSMLLATPPDAALLEDVRTLGWVESAEVSSLDDLQVEFTRLLSAPGPDAVAAHQSIYTDTLRIEASGADALGCGMTFPGGEFQGHLGGESCAQVKRCYDAVLFTPQDQAPAMADHMSTQLGFFAHLYLAEARARTGGEIDDARAFRELRDEFFARFLGRWIGAFGEKLSSNLVSKFYRQVGIQLLCTALEGRGYE